MEAALRIAGQTIETANDVQRICAEGWLESQQLDFKREDSDRGKDIAKEVVALANHVGGHVIIGIDESDEAPARAARIAPIKDAGDVASRLERQLRDKIDPPIRGLVVHPIATTDDGAGVIIIEVPQSALGPHRSGHNQHVYYRAGTQSLPLTMSQVHRLVLDFEKREDRVEKRFEELRSLSDYEFKTMFAQLLFRAGAVPLGDLHLELEPAPLVWFLPIEITASDGEKSPPIEIATPSRRPMLRGAWRERASDDRNLRSYLLENGSLQLNLQVRNRAGQGPLASEIVQATYSLLHAIDAVASAADCSGCEYGIEIEFAANGSSKIARFLTPLGSAARQSGLEPYPADISGGHRRLPRYAYSPGNEAEKLALVNFFWRDFWNVLGAEPPNTITVIEFA